MNEQAKNEGAEGGSWCKRKFQEETKRRERMRLEWRVEEEEDRD